MGTQCSAATEIFKPTSTQHQDSQMTAKYLSKQRFSKASVVLAFNKEKGRLFFPNSLTLHQMMELLLTCCTQQLCLPRTRGVHKKAKPWQ